MELLGHPCQDFTKLGTNHLQQMLTCLVCGHSVKSQITTEPIYAEHECPHDITDHRYSTRSIQKTFCVQCQTFIDSRPRDEFLKAKKVTDQVLRSSSLTIEACEKLLDEIQMNRDQMARIMAMFQGTVGAHYQDHPTIDSSTLKAMLDNAIDAIMQAPGASASSGHTAMVPAKRRNG